MMDKKNKELEYEKSRHKAFRANVTLPLADVEWREKDSNISIPSDINVERAKDWVDYNEK